MRQFFLILAALILIACSDDSDPKKGYIETNTPDVYETCHSGECGPYPELTKCGDGGQFPIDVRCVFVSGTGCYWVIFKCQPTDEP